MGEGWGGGGKAHSMGPNIRIPRTWVSLPFMWFARMMTWRMYACIGLLTKKKKVGLTVLQCDIGR